MSQVSNSKHHKRQPAPVSAQANEFVKFQPALFLLEQGSSTALRNKRPSSIKILKNADSKVSLGTSSSDMASTILEGKAQKLPKR